MQSSKKLSNVSRIRLYIAKMVKPFRRLWIAIFVLALAGCAFTYNPTAYSEPVQKSAPFVGAFDVRKYGAKGDGKALDSPAINKAIDAAAAAGGGTVLFTAGTYRSFSIRLKSNVALNLDQAPPFSPRILTTATANTICRSQTRGTSTSDVEVSYLSPDQRPAFWLNDVAGAEFIHVKAQREADVPSFVLKNVSDFSLQQSWPLADQRLDRVDTRKL